MPAKSKPDEEVLRLIEPFKIEAEAIRVLNSPDSPDFLIDSSYASADTDSNLVALFADSLLIKTKQELYRNLERRTSETLYGLSESTERKDELFADELRFVNEYLETVLKQCDEIFDEKVHKILSHEKPIESIAVRKEAIPFYLYHHRKYGSVSPRRIGNLLLDSEEMAMYVRPFKLVDKRNGKYIRYNIKAEVMKEGVVCIFFKREPYYKCKACGKDCVQLKHLCGSCKVTCYCCTECQRGDYPHHKLECEVLKRGRMNHQGVSP